MLWAAEPGILGLGLGTRQASFSSNLVHEQAVCRDPFVLTIGLTGVVLPRMEAPGNIPCCDERAYVGAVGRVMVPGEP